MSAYQQARTRVDETPELEPHEFVLLVYDWNDPNHYQWVATAPLNEILNWIESINPEGEQD